MILPNNNNNNNNRSLKNLVAFKSAFIRNSMELKRIDHLFVVSDQKAISTWRNGGNIKQFLSTKRVLIK